MDWIRKRALLTGGKTAIIDIEKKRTLTFNELNQSANRWAQFLLEQQIGKGDRVALLAENQAEIFELFFACGKIGAILVPVNWRLAEREIQYIIGNCQPKLLIYEEKYEKVVLRLEQVKSQKLEHPSEKFSASFEAETNITEEDPWLIIYTGGTTGNPKGVVLTHRSVDWNAMNTIISWGLTSEEITLTYMPLFHTGGINALSLPILMNGGTVVIGNKFDPREALLYLKKYKCTIALFVPTMYHMMQQTEEFEKLDFPDMKVFLSGGAPCPLSIYEKFYKKGLRFKEGYGLTEAGPNNFFITPEEAEKKPGSVGKPMMFNDVKIVKQDGSIAGDMEVGELLVKGNYTFSEYWNNPEATKAAWQNEWLCTGDLAMRDADGYHYIVGRKKDMIITGGENVYPLEIEQWLSEHPAINENAVVGIPDEKWGERVVAFISLHANGKVTEEDLKAYCAKRLAKYKIPKQFIILDEIPKTPVGKIDKKVLQEWKGLNENSSRSVLS